MYQIMHFSQTLIFVGRNSIINIFKLKIKIIEKVKMDCIQKRNISKKYEKVSDEHFSQIEVSIKIISGTKIETQFLSNRESMTNSIFVCKVHIFKLTWLFKFLHCSTVSAIPFDPGYLINKLKILQNVNFFNFDSTNNIIVLSLSWWLYKLIKYMYHSNNLLSYLYVQI